MDAKTREAIISGLHSIGAGVRKLAELANAKPDPMSDEEKTAIAQTAERVAAKLAEMGITAKSEIPVNAARMTASHARGLLCAESVLDIVADRTAKRSESPSSLGEPAGVAAVSAANRRQAVRPPRC